MERIVMIKEVGAYSERQYTTREGKADVFSTRGFILACGDEEFYGEMVGDNARKNRETTYVSNTPYLLKGAWRHRTWYTKENEARHENWLVINSLNTL